jgi:hypothetical protein
MNYIHHKSEIQYLLSKLKKRESYTKKDDQETSKLNEEYEENNTKNNYSRTYICYEDNFDNYINIDFDTTKTYLLVDGFRCYKYNYIDSIECVLYRTTDNRENYERHTIVTISKWIPEMCDKYILYWKLNKQFSIRKFKIYSV